MDTKYTGFVLIVGLLCYVLGENKYGDHGIVLTARPFVNTEDYRQLVAIPTTPREIANYAARTFPGIQFDDKQVKFHACDVDYDMNLLYMYDYNYRRIVVGSNFNTSLDKTQINFTTEHYSISKEYVKVAVDWISHNIYWADTLMGAIVMSIGGQNISQTLYKVIINTHLDLPRGITVDPVAGYIFWTDFSKISKIERATLLGENRTVLIPKSGKGHALTLPDAITADHINQRLYFTNDKNIETIDYNGDNRRIIASEPNAYFFDIAFYGDVVMATDIDSPYYAYFYDINTGEQIAKEDGSDEAYFGICMYHKDNQPSVAEYQCPTAGCQDICVEDPIRNEARCVCRTGYQLNADGKTCEFVAGQYERAVILNNGTDLCLLDIRILSDHHNHKVDCFYHHNDASETMTYIEVNGRSREVYFATQKAIYSIPIDRQNAEATKLTETLPSTKGNGEITGISYDYVSGHLYWAETNPDAIFVMNPDSPAAEFVQLASANHNLSNPRAILVLPHERQLLWLNGNATEGVIIMKTDLGASAPVEAIVPSELPTSVYILKPTHMMHHVKDNRLYILDQGWSEILVFKFDGEYLTDYDTNDAKDFALYNDYILVAHHDSNNNTAMFSADLGFGPPFTKIVEEEDGVVEDIGLVVSMRILDVDVLQPSYPDPCKDLNGKSGGCDQICIAISEQTTCMCDTGFTLGSDGKSCESKTVSDNFALMVDETHSKLFQISLDQTDVIAGIQTASQTQLTGVLYNYLTKKVILGSEDSDQIWQVEIDGTNETMLTDLSWYSGSPVRFALDPSTGNLYVTAVSHWAWWFDDYSFLIVVHPSGKDTLLLEGGSGSSVTINSPGDIVVHPGMGYMFWTDPGTAWYDGKICRAGMDGYNEIIIAQGTGIEMPYSLAIDYDANELYWSDEYLKGIYKSDLDGNNRVTVMENVAGVINDMRIVGNYLYYTNKKKTKITRVHKSNTSDVLEFGPDAGVGVLGALDIHISAEVPKVPKHAICSDSNGGCSDFCLPSGAGSRTCGCEKYYHLLSDDRTCEYHGCPGIIGNAYIASDCLRLPGYQCSFECFRDLKPKANILKVTCLSNKTWDINMPCRERYHQNKYGDHGVVLTARGFDLQDFNQVVAIPAKPQEISTYPARSFPGFRFPDIRKKLHACDVDYHTNMIFLYDYEYRSIFVGSNFSMDANLDNMNFTTEHYGVAKEYVKVAVDWINHNVYWTDGLMGAIMMMVGKQDVPPTQYKIVVQKHLDLPRGIAVDPLAGYIFWTDISTHSRIGRASLLGENPIPIITNALFIPDAIAVDHVSQRIFFTNYDSIDSANYDGRGRINLVKNSQANFFDISVFNNVIMATDLNKYYLFLYDANTGTEIGQEGSSQEGFFGVCTYDEGAQPPVSQELCVTAGCQDFCVEEPNAVTATCACRQGFELQEDGKTCKEVTGQYERAILLNNGTHLCLLDISILSDHHDHKVDCFYQHKDANITYIDVNMRSREVYFTAGKSIYRVPINFGSNVMASQLTSLPTDQATQFTGLSYDWINDHLYWSQTGPDGVFMINPDSPEEFLQVAAADSTYKPRAVLVVPHNGTVFWIASNHTSEDITFIEYGDLGLMRPMQQIVPTSSGDLRQPTHLLHDNKNDQLYVLDIGWHFILQASYNGTLTNYFPCKDAKDFALYNDYMLVMEHDKYGNTRLYSGDIEYDFPNELHDDGIVEDIGTVISLKIIDVDVLQKTYPSPCGMKEGKYGGCEQICIPVDEKPTCHCDTGFTLNADNMTCDSSVVNDSFIIVVDNLHSKIYQIPLADDRQLHGIKVPNRDNPTGIIYNYLTNQLVFGSGDSSYIWAVNIDGSNATFIADIDEWFGTPTNFAIDRTTGNLFITAYSYYADYYQDSFIAAISPDGGVAIIYDQGHYLADIVLHAGKGYMFWTDYGKPAMVARAGMDGTHIIQIADDSVVSYPTGLAIDYEADQLYWQDALLHKIFKSDLDGNNRIVFHKDTSYMNDIRLFGDYLYYTALDNLHLTRIHKDDASGAKRIGPTSGIGAFATIDIYSSEMVSKIPVNSVCSKDNGNCSHFCLPNGEGGRTCGCEGYYELLSDGITCENVPRCQSVIPGGTIDDSCHRLVGQQCDVTCNHGYKKKDGVQKLLCQQTVDYEPKWNDEIVCEEIFCPAIIPNGQLLPKCTRKVDANCIDYTCNSGYEKNPALSSLNCTINGVWGTDITTLCNEKCPLLTFDENMAILNKNCNRDIDERCGYTCKENYRQATNMTTIHCVSPSRWDVNTATLCEEILCPDYVPNGLVHTNCSFKVNSMCTFSCGERYSHNDRVSKIKCLSSGQWDKVNDETTLCYAIAAPGTPERQTDSVAVGLGVGIAILVIIIIVIIVFIMLYRMGKLHIPSRKSGGSGSAFENPQYQESSFDAPPGVPRESNKTFSYATLEEDKLELTDESWRKTAAQSQASENVYDNKEPATLAASAINPKF